MLPPNQNREKFMSFIRDYIDRKGYPPTVRDILRSLRISSPAVVQYHLKVLDEEGRIRREPGIRRGLTLADRPASTVRVPLLGTIAAGEPIPVPQSDAWHEEPVDMLELPPDMAGREDIYALRVKGHSMIDALIDDGDTVIMQSTSTVNNGEMAAVWLREEREATLKKVYREGGRIRLQPANSQMEPMFHDARNVAIQGRVIGVIRHLS